MTAIHDLPNIGPASAEWLENVGIRTLTDLETLGAAETYKRVRLVYPHRVSLNLLWALQGAILGIPWDQLPEDMKTTLKQQLED